MTDQMRVTVERDGHVLLMGLNRADNRNFFDFAMLEQLVTAYGRLANVPDQVVTPSMPVITCPPSHEPRLFRLVNSYASSAEPKLPDSASHRRRESSTYREAAA